MKGLNNLILIFAIIFLNSCIQNSSFSKEELGFFKPYFKADTAIYKSLKGQLDTVIFTKMTIDTVEVRSIEQGFYNNNILRVSYKLTENSYHKVTVKSINNEPDDFLSISKAKNSHSSKEIYFLGLLFDEEYFDKIINIIQTEVIVFDESKAKYKDANINEGIKSFKFSFTKGILSFVDKNNVEWLRIN